MRRFGLVVALMGLPVGKLAAQHAGQFEAGAFSSYTRYDPAFGLADKVGGGVRLGYLFGDLVGIEGDVLFQPQYTVSPLGTPITLEPLIGSASVVVNVLHASHWMLYALGGYSVLDFGTRDPYHFTDNAAHAAAGVRLFLSNRIALRLEGRAVYSPKTQYTLGSATATHYVATAGLSVFHLGGGPVKDSDKDGVPDDRDACPDTPIGAVVDQRGCPLDSDHDGVPDGIDKCPETPLGAHVDATGCPTDADGDGVPDGIDQCPNTPAGVHVDAKGCPIDSDGDGVPDGIDQCPDTPPGATVDARGCPADSDGDGVPDGIDKCPNTPKGAIVDATGCPLDSDLDGVPDGIDQCPNTPPGTRVDAVGCPLPAEQVKAAPVSPPVPAAPAAPAPAPPMTPVVPPKCPPAPPGSQVDANGCLILFAPESVRAAVPGAPPRPTVILRGVNFQTGRSALTRDSYAALDAVAASLVANPDIRIEIAGYTDSTGRKFLNFRLSQARAAAVRAYLARKGVLPARMVAKGYGATGFIAPNATADGRAQNRRVELHKLP
ncbi:MAG TPA: thrombospondin type 3 repeat-containing protein [Gemmatimonadales bacterium]|nr:thrombospondin type 3 repeat-containing protein [Gemmatimonadales bacterium]